MKISIPVPSHRPKLYVATASPELSIQSYTGQNGLYSAVQPDKTAKQYIMELAKQLGFDIDPEALHCTVMYSKECCPNPVACEQDRVFRGRLEKIQHWDGHDKIGYVTAAINSPELHEEHHRLKALGCVPTFDYNPHVTLWAGAKLNDRLQNLMDTVTANLSSLPELKFVNQFIGDLKDD